MNTRIYFTNLPKTVTENELMDLFSAYGNVVSAHIATDRAGFVTMVMPESARTATQSLNGKVLPSGILTLSEVPPKGERVNLTNSPVGPRRRASHLY